MHGVINVEFDQEVLFPNNILEWKGYNALDDADINDDGIIGIKILPGEE